MGLIMSKPKGRRGRDMKRKRGGIAWAMIEVPVIDKDGRFSVSLPLSPSKISRFSSSKT